MESRVRLEFHPKQRIAFESEATEIGYGGAAGGGKSYTLRAIGIHSCSQVPGLKAFLFRKHFEELIQNHVDSTNGFREVLAPWIESKKVRVLEDEIEFWNGSKIYLCHCSHSKHLEKYLGPEMHLLLIDQAEQFPERWLRFLRHRVRMSEEQKKRVPEQLRGRFPRIVLSFNPGGTSHSYLRKQFVKSAAPLAIHRTDAKEGGFLRQFIPAFLRDNPSLNEAEYTGALMGLNDTQLVKAMLEGNFDALVGNFFTQYDENTHVVPNFMPPAHWFKFRTFDWGSAEPFAVYWWCVSDGVEFKDGQGRTRWFPAGALIAYREWYGCNPEQPAKGLEMRNQAVAQGIISRTIEQTSGITVTDSKPFQDAGMGANKEQKYKPADVFKDNGCPLIQGNCARVHGWSQLRDRLIGVDGFPLLYLTESCIYARDYLPAIGRSELNPEDAEDSGEATHSPDAIRLACTTRPIIIKAPDNSQASNERGKMTPKDILAEIKRQKTQHGRR